MNFVVQGVERQVAAFTDAMKQVLPVSKLLVFTTSELLESVCGEAVHWDEETVRDCIVSHCIILFFLTSLMNAGAHVLSAELCCIVHADSGRGLHKHRPTVPVAAAGGRQHGRIGAQRFPEVCHGTSAPALRRPTGLDPQGAMRRLNASHVWLRKSQLCLPHIDTDSAGAAG